jgi:hypothetical protein
MKNNAGRRRSGDHSRGAGMVKLSEILLGVR